MEQAYLYLNAVLYAALAAWCTLSPRSTAAAQGFHQLANGGRSEYLVIYGGLQFGLAAFFWYVARLPDPRVGLVFALALYVPIVLFRLVTVARFRPVGATTSIVAGLEVVLLAAAIVLWWRHD